MSQNFLSFRPPVIAHRGARNRTPENTMAAFLAAREDGAAWIETDVKLTSDGVPILMHDDLLDRTTSGRGPVADAPWDVISQLDAGSWFAPEFAASRVPTLAELLAFAGQSGMRLNLELKPCPGRTLATAMVTLIEAAKLWPESAPPLLISSFDVEALVIAARMHPDWPRGLLLDEWHEDWRELMTKTQATALHIDADVLTPERIQILRDTHVPILTYTVNDPEKASQLLQSGVSAVFSDNPGPMIKHLSP